jgi:hypothetical protein
MVGVTMNDLDLKQILDHKDKTINMQSETIWHRDRKIEKLEAIIEDKNQLIALMEDKLALTYLENDILRGKRDYDNNLKEDNTEEHPLIMKLEL